MPREHLRLRFEAGREARPAAALQGLADLVAGTAVTGLVAVAGTVAAGVAGGVTGHRAIGGGVLYRRTAATARTDAAARTPTTGAGGGNVGGGVAGGSAGTRLAAGPRSTPRT